MVATPNKPTVVAEHILAQCVATTEDMELHIKAKTFGGGTPIVSEQEESANVLGTNHTV